MTVVYVLDHGCQINKEGETICVTSSGELLYKLPFADVTSIAIFGFAQITTQALLAASDSSIPITFHTEKGQFRAFCLPAYSKNVFLRVSQFKLYEDQEFRLNFAKKIISANSDFEFGVMEERIRNAARNLLKAEDLSLLLGHEGNSAKLYFSCFQNCLTKSVDFKGRQYFPSPDLINASLSFGYSMLAKEIQSYLYIHGPDPFIGFFHQLVYGRASLALDLIEEFRHIVIDRLVLNLFNKSIHSEDDFEKSNDGGFYLKKPNLKRYLSAYEDYLNQTTYPFDGKKIIFRELLKKQVEKFKNSVENKTEYQPYFLSEHK